MGSRPSTVKKQPDTSHYGKICLQTDKTVYSPGDTVTGTIFLDLISPYPGNQLFLKFKGKEVAHVVQEYQTTIDTENGPITVSDYRKGSDKHKIINQSQVIHSWEKLSPSRFSFPFSFLIPQNGIPGSFYQQGPFYLAFIEYQVKVFLKPFCNRDPKLKYKQPLIIKETFLANPRNTLIRETTVLKTCGCFQRGSNTLKAIFTKNSYSHEEKVEVLVELDHSKTKLKPDQIKFYLVQMLSVRASGESQFRSEKRVKIKQAFAEKTIDPEVRARSLSLTLPPFAKESDFQRKINRERPSKGKLMGLLEYKGGITCSTHGRFVDSQFYLRVKCSTNGFCTTYSSILFPILVCPSDLEFPVLPLPSDWQTKPLENKIISFSQPGDMNDKKEHKNSTNSSIQIEVSPMCLPELPPNRIEDRQNPTD